MSNTDFSYVRTQMLPEQEPPLGEKGIVKWMRENLFSGFLNSILTLLSLFAIYWVVAHLWPWLSHTVWSADSLTECREIRDASWGADVSSACFAVVRDRWHQFVFGFYPQNGYWRPVLALIVFLAAIAPILFESAPRKLLWLTPAAPLIMFYLLWGGSLWGPIVAALGFVIGFYAFRLLSNMGSLAAALGAIILPIIYWLFISGPLFNALSGAVPLNLLEFVQSKDMGGFTLAVIIGVAGIVLSLPLGILLALGRQSDMFIINKLSVVFIEVIRGVPLIVWLFTASLLLNYFLPPGTNFDLMLRVIIMVTLFSAAYIAEVIRGGLAALPAGQYEGANSLGLNYWQSMRLIILPQALKISIPGIVNTFIGLFKDTTLVVFIGMSDVIGFSNLVRASTDWNGVYWEIFIFIGLMFFIACFSMGRYSLFLEKKLQREHR